MTRIEDVATSTVGTTRRDRTAARRPRSRGALVAALAVPLGIVASGALVWQASYAAFTATTTNEGNSWETGSVVLSDNDSSSALFAAEDLDHGSTGARCIQVTYAGSMASDVRMYATSPTGTLNDDLRLTVTTGTGGDASCVGFTPDATSLYNDGHDDDALTLGAFAVAHTEWSDGLQGWTPAAGADVTPVTTTYQIRWTVLGTATQQEVGGVTFAWTAQSS